MEPALMLKTALALLTLVALLGVVMAVIRLGRNANPPSWLAMLHGLLAAMALTLLVFAFLTGAAPALAGWAVLLLVLAAVGGAYLNLGYHVKGALVPKPIVIVHALVAVSGYTLLAMSVFGWSLKT